MRRRDREQLFENLNRESGITNEEYYMAYKRVKKIKGFYVHFIVYVFVNLFLILNRRFESNSNACFFEIQTYATAFFWGIGLLAHGMSVFSKEVFFGPEWEAKKIKKYMDKNKRFE